MRERIAGSILINSLPHNNASLARQKNSKNRLIFNAVLLLRSLEVFESELSELYALILLDILLVCISHASPEF